MTEAEIDLTLDVCGREGGGGGGGGGGRDAEGKKGGLTMM